MNSTLEHAVGPKLPLWDTICRSYATYFDHFADVLRISWLWLAVCALLIGVSTFAQLSFMADIMRQVEQGYSAQAISQMSKSFGLIVVGNISQLIVVLAGVSIAVAWHRRVILDELPGFCGSNLASKNLWRYIGVGLLIFLISAIPVAAFVFSASLWLATKNANASSTELPTLIILLPLLFFLVVFAVFLRLSLLLPARAVGNLNLNFRQTWTSTRGNTWRIWWGLAACMLPPFVPAQIAFIAAVGFPGSATLDFEAFAGRMTVVNVLFSVFVLLCMPICIGFLSLAYRHFFSGIHSD